MDYRLSPDRVISPAKDNESLADSLATVRKYQAMIVDDVLASLEVLNSQLSALSAFSQGLEHYPHTMPTQQGTLADHDPKQLIDQLVAAGLFGFRDWFDEKMLEEYDDFRESLIDRNLYHFFENMRSRSRELALALAQMKVEFAQGNYQAKTLWLSHFFNGMQTRVFEMYVIDQFLD